MNIRSLCLAILYFGDATGYEIKKQSTEGTFSYFVDASFGSIYPALARLEADGMVTARRETKQGKPARKVYSITASGREEFMKALQEPQSPDLFRSQFLLLAACAELVTPERIRAAMDLHVEQIEQELSKLNGVISACNSEGVRWAAEFGIHCMTQKRAYVDANRDRLVAISANAQAEREAAMSAPPEAAE